MNEMFLDIDHAYSVWAENNKGVKKVNKELFLKELGMSWQTANNYQSGFSAMKVLQYAEKIKSVTGLGFDEFIKKKK